MSCSPAITRHPPRRSVLGLLLACAVCVSSPPRCHAAAAPGDAQAAAAAGSHAHDDHGGHGDIDFNKPPLPGFAPGLGELFVVSLVLFVGFVFAARSLLWAPLIAALDQREARILQAKAGAEAAQVEAQRLLALHDARMAEVQVEVQGIVAQARKEAEQEKSRIIADAEAQARALRESAIADIESARQQALGEIERSLDSQAARAVELVVGGV